ncbi:hypothetical protein GcC1_159007 [Golovinomyces cichoracearum]|uniref:CCHC-type domain-containing protein n=1 Tax=Golovinomyces cichoracearum TaxID=62708 RepID=A0A420HUV8_9PEZI|nr:hypothetical protein GcC1_159007 [Golovinomyces cichoracearum]
MDFRPHYDYVTPEIFFEAIEVLFTGKAESWLDSIPQFNRFMDQEEEPRHIDMENFKQAWMKQSPKKSVEGMDDINAQENIQNLRQGEEETILEYHDRAQDLLRRSNGRDEGIRTQPELTAIERTMLSILVRAFVRGIRDDNLRSMIMMKSKIFHGSLQGAFEKTKKAMACIAQRKEIEIERLERTELDLFRKQYQKKWGQPLSVALAGVNQGRNQEDVGPSIRTYEQRSSWQNQPTARPILESPNANGRINQVQKLFISGPTQPLTNPTDRRNNYDQKEIPPRHLSRHPIVNGSKSYGKDGSFLCVRCGEFGHKRPECTGRSLEWWEQIHLWDLVMPKLASNYVGYVNSGAGLRYRDIDNSYWRGATKADLIKRRDTPSEAQNFEENKDPEEVEYTYEDFTGTVLQEVETQSSYCMSVMLGISGEESTGKSQENKRVRFYQAKEKQPVKLDAFLNIGDGRKRARPLDWDEILNREEKDMKSRKKENQKREKVAKQLREIIGRRGKSSFDYKRLVEDIKVEVSLMDLFQVSPDLSRAFKSLSTRVTEKSMRTRKTMDAKLN